ncbi:MAG: Maf family protein [Acidaminococcaceae bacterium]|jgi:septum formation protein|nr:Maf family protein [Acidaminococcaceae bacterium]
MKVILASASPRRQELLQQVGWELEVRVAPFTEAKTTTELAGLLAGGEPSWLAGCHQGKSLESAEALVAYNAFGKAGAVQKQLADVAAAAGIPAEAVAEGTAVPIVAADTVVVRREQIMGKPVDKQEAARMLTELSGGWHQVLTGVAVFYRRQRVVQVVRTDVHFRKLSSAEITAYVATGEPLDKAGAYGIQGRAALFCDRLEGSYDNVVGLPLAALDVLVHQVLQTPK